MIAAAAVEVAGNGTAPLQAADPQRAALALGQVEAAKQLAAAQGEVLDPVGQSLGAIKAAG